MSLRSLLHAWLPVVLCMAAIFIISADSNPYRVLPLQAADAAIQTPPATSAAAASAAPETGAPQGAAQAGDLAATPTYTYARRTPQQDQAVEWIGDLAHVAEYALLALLSARALRLSAARGWGLVGGAALLCAVFALADELHQVFVPGRRFQTTDLLLDLAGTALGLAVFWRLSAKKDESSQDRLTHSQ